MRRVAADRPPSGTREPLARADALVGGALALLAWALYRRTAPAVVNLDGLGYLKLIPHNFAAGHLLFMPLVRFAAARFHGDGLAAARAVDAAAAAAAIGLAFACARAFLGRGPSALAAAGLAVSYGVWVQGADVEVYACALAALLALFALLCAYRERPTAGVAAAAGVALGVAVLFHVTHVLAVPLVLTWMIVHARRRRLGLMHACLTCALGGALVVAAYAWAALGVRHLDAAGALRWVRTAAHGFRYSGDPLARIADSTYGLARALVWSPYLYESDAQRLLGQFLVGLTALGLLAGVVVVRRRALPPLPWLPLGAWAASYAAMALLYFGSDHERWLFVLPPLWLAAAAAVGTLRRAAAVGALAVALLAVANACMAIGPAMGERWDRTRAEQAASAMADGDLVIFPGHSWDEYIGFYGQRRFTLFPVSYYAGVHGPDGCLARLEREMAAARARGANLWTVRLPDDDADPRGFVELESLGLPRAALRARLARFRLVPVRTVEPKVTVWRIE
jgi:hypothetical protein